jgi:radical SAM protein with 4Fe4S-binding SPASM domain
MRKCLYPQNVLTIGNNGYTISCPLENGNLKFQHINQGISSAWKNQKFIEFRDNLEYHLSNNSKTCWQCNVLEKAGSMSIRTEFPILSEEPKLLAIQFKLSNRCQLVCAHCTPQLSSSWAKHAGLDIDKQIKEFTLTQNVIDEIIELVPNLSFIRFTGGEPWIDPQHWKLLEILDKIDKKNCELHYITNGLLPVKKQHLWNSWKKVKTIISLDGFDKTYEWFRRKAKWNTFVSSYEKLKNIENFEISFNFSVTPWTIESFELAKDFFDERINGIPIMGPYYCSLGSITHNEYKNLGLPYFEKFNNIIGTKPVAIKNLKSWAMMWDKRWNTEGLAEELYPWLQYIN